MTPTAMVAIAVAMLLSVAVLPAAKGLVARWHRELPFCMECDPSSCWSDHHAGQCVCPASTATEEIR